LISAFAGNSLATENRFVNSCTQARKKCEANPACKAAYQHLGSCTSSLSRPLPLEESAMSADCLEAAEQLRNSSLIDCRCHRRMKHQATCLDIYWTVHPARSLGKTTVLQRITVGEGVDLGRSFLNGVYRKGHIVTILWG
jgi:hypothetical protein